MFSGIPRSLNLSENEMLSNTFFWHITATGLPVSAGSSVNHKNLKYRVFFRNKRFKRDFYADGKNGHRSLLGQENPRNGELDDMHQSAEKNAAKLAGFILF
jgi:hypothetical protein